MKHASIVSKPRVYTSTVTPPSSLEGTSRFGNSGTFGAGAQAPAWVRLPSGMWVLDFDGVNDYISIPFNNAMWDLPAQTIMAWVNLREVKNERIISYWTGVGAADYLLTTPAVAPMNRIRIGRSNNSIVDTTYGLPLNSWFFITAVSVKNGANMDGSLYINGVLNASGSSAYVAPTNKATLSVIGQANDLANSLVFNGMMWISTMYNIVLDAGTIFKQFQKERHMYGV